MDELILSIVWICVLIAIPGAFIAIIVRTEKKQLAAWDSLYRQGKDALRHQDYDLAISCANELVRQGEYLVVPYYH